MKHELIDDVVTAVRTMRSTGKLSQARTLLEQTLEAASSAEITKEDQARLTGELAHVHIREGSWNRARQLLDEALDVLGPAGTKDAGLWASLNERKAWALFRAGKRDEARRVAEQTRDFIESRSDVFPTIAADVENTLGGIAWTDARLDDAIRHTQKAAELYNEGSDPIGAANASANLGVLYFTRGEWNSAIREYQNSEAIRSKHGIVCGRATALFNLGVMEFYLGDYAHAREHFQASLEMGQASGEQYEPARAEMALAHLDLIDHRLDEAARRIDHVIETSECICDDDRIQATWLKALVECDRGDIDRASRLASSAREMARTSKLVESEADSCRALATAYQREKRIGEAEELLHEAVRLAEQAGDSYRRGLALLDLADLHKRTAQPDAPTMFDEASALFEKLGAQYHVDRARALRQV